MSSDTRTNTPTCLGLIMDGNRRWAKNHGVTSAEGHSQGYRAFREILDCIHEKNIPHVVCYAFSTENWNRSPEEVSALMELLTYALKEMYSTITKDGKRIRLNVIGDRTQLPKNLIAEINTIEAIPISEPELTVWLALSYGGRAEILHTAQKLQKFEGEITEKVFSDALWTHGMPDPDLIIRTSGEMRISNFLLWQAAYSELFFTETLWPDFGKTELESILEEYAKRSRRIGT